MTEARLLIAGIGNLFLGDDAFGVEVAQRLLHRRLPAEVRVIDFGIRGLDLAYALLEGYETVILVDAACRGGPPGTIYVMELEVDPPHNSPAEIPAPEALDMHNLDPAKVLRLAQSLGEIRSQVLLIACEPQPSNEEAYVPGGLSPPVGEAVGEAVRLVESTVARLLKKSPPAEEFVHDPY